MHDCVDWTTKPPTRKTQLLILTRGNDHIYTPVPNDLKTLEDVARKEFDLGDEPGSHTLHGNISARTSGVPPSRSPKPRQEASAKRKLPSDVDEGHENDRLNVRAASSARETVRHAQDVTSDRASGNVRDGVQDEEPWEEEVSAIPPPRPRIRRRLASHSQGEDEEGDEEADRNVLAQSPPSPAASPPRLSQLSAKQIKKERFSDYHDQLDQNKPVDESGNNVRPETEHDTKAHTSSENDKLMIRVAHRPSKQESKFMAKATTKVAKVLAGACKSFGLDASQTSMYLIVSVEDEEGQMENLFPCDNNDSIARAGAERDMESRFLLKMEGEA